jgi:hypothetical protein
MLIGGSGIIGGSWIIGGSGMVWPSRRYALAMIRASTPSAPLA